MTRLVAVVLGSAAGGGYPQWNCRCAVCDLAWRGDPRVRRRTQSSLAASADGASWVLFNCSPDVREQIGATPRLWPPRPGRGSPIAAVVLTNGDIDHVGGLLSLRERAPLTVWASSMVMRALHDNPMFAALADDVVTWRELVPGEPVEPVPGVLVEAFAVPGKVPLYLEGAPAADPGATTIGLEVSGTAGGRIAYVPGCAGLDDAVVRRLDGADAVLFDGTLFSDDEMIRAGVGSKTGRRMGHMPIGGPDGTLAAFADAGIRAGRRVFLHVNNTNPVLVDGSPERAAVEAAGWTVAHDGLELVP